MSSRLLLLLLWAAPALAEDFSVDKGQIVFHMKHKLHKFDGVTHAVEGRAHVSGDQVQVAVRARVESFDSGDSNRDAHMKEVIEAARFPFVEIKAASELPLKNDERHLEAAADFHGVQKLIDVPIKITWDNDRRARVECHFTISLEAFGVERPSLMFTRVEDALPIEVNLQFVR